MKKDIKELLRILALNIRRLRKEKFVNKKTHEAIEVRDYPRDFHDLHLRIFYTDSRHQGWVIDFETFHKTFDKVVCM